MSNYLKQIVLLILTLSAFSFQTEKTTNLTITFQNIRSPKGQVIVSLYSDKEQYYDHPKFYHMFEKKNVEDGKMTVTVKDIQPGEYALSFLDDENSSNKMEYSWYGIPKEGFGFSNNQKASITGAPSYEKCLVNINEDTSISIELEYW